MDKKQNSMKKKGSIKGNKVENVVVKKYEYCSIVIGKNSVKVINNMTCSRDAFALRVSDKLDLLLGESLKTYETIMSTLRIPIIFEKMFSMNEYTTYKIVGMAVGDCRDIEYGTMVCDKNDTIIRITCSDAYRDNNDKYYTRPSLLWKASKFKKVDKEVDAANAVVNMLCITGLITSKDAIMHNQTVYSVESKYTLKEIDVKLSREDLTYTFAYYLDDSTDTYELSGVYI